MKAILEFNLPEEHSELEAASKASSLLCVLEELDNYLRGKTKYADADQSELVTQTYQEIRDELNRIIHDFEVEHL